QVRLVGANEVGGCLDDGAVEREDRARVIGRAEVDGEACRVWIQADAEERSAPLAGCPQTLAKAHSAPHLRHSLTMCPFVPALRGRHARRRRDTIMPVEPEQRGGPWRPTEGEWRDNGDRDRFGVSCANAAGCSSCAHRCEALPGPNPAPPLAGRQRTPRLRRLSQV